MKLTAQNIKFGLRVLSAINLDRKARLGPVRFDIAMTSACNFKCVFCGSHSAYVTPPKPEYLDAQTLKNIFTSLKELKTKDVVFAGNGEPMLSALTPAVVNQYGKEFNIELVTNGTRLARIDKEMFGNIKRLTVSLNSGNGKSHKQVHNYLGENQFQKIVSEIERLRTYENGQSKIRLYFVALNLNTNEIPDFIKLANELKVEQVQRPMQPLVPAMESQTTALQNHGLVDCYMGFIQGFITAKGDVLNCCSGAAPLGNLKDSRLVEIWRRDRSKRTRFKASRMGKTQKPLYPDCEVCVNARVINRIPFVKRYL